MYLRDRNKTYTLSPRDLSVMAQARVGFHQLAGLTPRYPGLPPLWSKLPYLMLLYPQGTAPKYFWKHFREFNDLLKTRDSAYRAARIPKNTGGHRTLLVPGWELRRHQRYIQKEILYRIPASEHACAYRKRRGLTDLAAPHVGHKVLLHFDIRDFFTSITEQMVYERLLAETGYPPAVAGFLARLCCYKGYLPQGACTSPALSNICFKPCDEELAQLAQRHGLAYTRYSDDLYLSGDDFGVRKVITAVREILSRHGFRLNGKKTRVLGQHQAQAVTSLVVNEKLQVSREYRRQLRQELYYLFRFGIQANAAREAECYTDYLCRLMGRVSFVLYADPDNREFREARDRLEIMLDAAWNLQSPTWATPVPPYAVEY